MTILLPLILVSAMQAAPPGVQVLSRDMMSQVDEPKQVVARNASEWAALWREHAGAKPLPAVDFGSRMVVAIFVGSRSSAGYSADVTRLRPADGALVIEWQERSPAPGEVSAQVMTSPAAIVTVPRFDGKITFEKVGR
jgi:hypothetical protein